MMTAATAAGHISFTVIGRMNGCAGHVLKECNDETAVTGVTGMHIESYDTERVLKHQKDCRNTYENILFHNLQSYEIFHYFCNDNYEIHELKLIQT